MNWNRWKIKQIPWAAAAGEAADVDNVTTINYPPLLEDFEGWTEKKKILVILAHPDDPEFFCGAMISRWTSIGHEVRYCLFTTGQKGSQNVNQTPEELKSIRMQEQRNAVEMLGVKSVDFLDYVDGEIVPDLEMRKRIVRMIRKYAPQIVVTSDPQNIFPTDNRINHPDHRAAGQVVVDSVFPAAGNPMYFPDLVLNEHLEPVNIEELWLSATVQPNLVVDMTDYFENKISVILNHKSQIGPNAAEFVKFMRTRFVEDPISGKQYYPEKFKRIILK
jgi:LmbE family N-acetylglucosaminyl deacetylase